MRRHFHSALTRDYIGWSLYHPKIGYFNRPGVIHSPPAIPFQQLTGGGAYKKHVAGLVRIASVYSVFCRAYD
jgi:hypothetical protein